MSTYALAALPDDRALAAQADRLRRAHATLLATLAQPALSPGAEARSQEFRSLDQELVAVEGRIGVAAALARSAERASRAAASRLGLRFLWLERRAKDDDLDADAEQERPATAEEAARARRGR